MLQNHENLQTLSFEFVQHESRRAYTGFRLAASRLIN